jgi:hypothetical protein
VFEYGCLQNMILLSLKAFPIVVLYEQNWWLITDHIISSCCMAPTRFGLRESLMNGGTETTVHDRRQNASLSHNRNKVHVSHVADGLRPADFQAEMMIIAPTV